MVSNWPIVSIDELKANSKGAIAIGPFGSRMKSDCYVEEGIPVIRGTNITGGPIFDGQFVYITENKADSLGSSNVYQYDLVFPHRGSIGEVGILIQDKRYVISSSLMKFTCDKNRANPKFIYYFFKSKLGRHELLKNASQVGTPGIGQPLTSLKSILLKLPPLEIQDKIEKILTSLDDKIELNKQTNQTLEQMAQALFKSWFVDFDPVFDNAFDAGLSVDDFPDELQHRAMLRQQHRSDAMRQDAEVMMPQTPQSTAVLQRHDQQAAQTESERIRGLFPSEFEQCDDPSIGINGWIPKGWFCSALANFISVKHGYAFKGEFFCDEPTNDILLTPGNVSIGGGFKGDKFKYYNGPIMDEYVFIGGDMFITMTDLSKAGDTLGFPALVPSREGLIFHHNQRLGRVGFVNASKFGSEFIYRCLCSNEYRNYIVASATGTTVKHTSPTKILNHKIVNSGGILEPVFEHYVQLITEKKEANNSNSITLSQTRDYLLPKLISGELQLSEAVQSIETK
ncbi:restriction endonuclease subunit S [Shewanella frigidimarina]|uniref:restriction endonuclease subunit S n=1 Tax=Shewanella frigidimarina TaxID=56812 RepID=UPI003F9F3635